jgi:hypothetical protein
LTLEVIVHHLVFPSSSRGRAQQRFDRAVFIHGTVTLGDLVEREDQVEDLPGIDLALPDQVDEFRQYRRTGAGPPSSLTCR